MRSGLAVGIENYNDAGAFAHFGAFGTNEQASYATVDTHVGKWDFNIGIGEGYGTSGDHLVGKMVLGVPI